MPTTLLQLGLGAWQRSIDDDDPDRSSWGRIGRLVADWAVVRGGMAVTVRSPLAHCHTPTRSTLRGIGAASRASREPAGAARMGAQAQRAARSLLDGEHGLVAPTPEAMAPGVTRPTRPPTCSMADLGAARPLRSRACAVRRGRRDDSSDAALAFADGVATLVAHLPQYELGRDWSTYDRFPHGVANVASPFYHRLHVDLLRALRRVAAEGGIEQERLEEGSGALGACAGSAH